MPGQLTLWEREQIAQFRNRGWSRAKIARQLKRHPATIGRELTRNSDGDRYWASVAEEKAAARRQRRPRKLHDPRPREYVRAGLAKRWPLAVVFAVRPATGAAGKTREIAGPGPDRGPAGHRGPETTVRRLGGRYGRRQGTSQRVVTLVDRKSGFALVAKVQRLVNMHEGDAGASAVERNSMHGWAPDAYTHTRTAGGW